MRQSTSASAALNKTQLPFSFIIHKHGKVSRPRLPSIDYLSLTNPPLQDKANGAKINWRQSAAKRAGDEMCKENGA
jgi:hypothetical protein